MCLGCDKGSVAGVRGVGDCCIAAPVVFAGVVGRGRLAILHAMRKDGCLVVVAVVVGSGGGIQEDNEYVRL